MPLGDVQEAASHAGVLRVAPQSASDDQGASFGPKLSAKGGGSLQLVAYTIS